MSILVFLFTLSILVFVHEFGHFLAAKKSGVEVEEFGFGLPPRIFGKKVGGTVYSINLLPIGGFVKLKGEEGEMLGFGGPGSFASAQKRKRLAIIFAGVLGNLLLSYIIFTVLFTVGNPTFLGKVFINEVSEGSPAEQAGFLPNDEIVSVDAVRIQDSQQFIKEVGARKGKEVNFVVKRGGREQRLWAVPRAVPPAGEGPLGVKIGFDGHLTYVKFPLPQSFAAAGKEVLNVLGQMVSGLQGMALEAFKGRAPQEVTGVVGIYKLSTQAFDAGYQIYFQFMAIISLNLFLINILPIPALDGGRALFVIYEIIFRKKINARVEKIVNNVGIALLLTLFVLVTIRDIRRF